MPNGFRNDINGLRAKLSDFFCNDKYCHFTLDNQPLLRDADHMTYSKSKKLAPFFRTIFE
ncbi:SGNH hydrolase domain-containing protein [Acinetobacter soli]|uniref:SGNH hydrolase domain-containing protein n=1 Tax=Acinetobacter soli TaxID=487316 RepID=UPI003B97E2FB